MPTSADRPWAADTSFAVAALDETHEAHATCRDLARQRRPVLAGHAAFETFSVLTRLPGALRPTAETVAGLLARAFPHPCWLSANDHADLLSRLGAIDVEGGQVYEALVAETARANGRTLMTRDRRARRTYELVGVDDELLG